MLQKLPGVIRPDADRTIAIRRGFTSPHKYVYFCTTHRKWVVQVRVGRIRVFGGRFKQLEDALVRRDQVVKEQYSAI